ncbi:MAG: prepilin-type N-terminal cleavage/methylation domain-containing protein [Desulfobia sp.]
MNLELKTTYGFTLLEVIAVLIIIGLLAAVAVSRMGSGQGELAKATGSLKSHLHFAQGIAMNSNRSWGISSTGSSYWLFSGDKDNKELLPGEEDKTITLSDPVSTGSFTVCFDEWGSPHDSVPPDNDTKIKNDMTITVNAGSDSDTIIITKETGFIP